MIDQKTHGYNLSLGIVVGLYITLILFGLEMLKKKIFYEHTGKEPLFDLIILFAIAILIVIDLFWMSKKYVRKQ